MLWSSERGFAFSGDYVQFSMDDQKTPAGVACRVSWAALDVLAQRSGLKHSEEISVRFRTFRSAVEKIASDKYDRGAIETDGTIAVDAKDVT